MFRRSGNLEGVRAKSAAEHEQPISRIGQRRQVVIPLSIFKTLNFQAGDFVAFARHGNGLLLKPKRVVETGETLTPTESKRLRQSLKQTRQDKTRPWAEIKDELGL
jgi:bifunctional DNA-binding transcriptional regulator/antitoxin component of YhaV-PrlF toxin-antitoxin module